MPDRITWDGHHSGCHIVSSLYKQLQPQRPLDAAAKAIWRTPAPLKVQITLRLASLNRLLISVLAECHI